MSGTAAQRAMTQSFKRIVGHLFLVDFTSDTQMGHAGEKS
jgi:hypothetical protein